MSITLQDLGRRYNREWVFRHIDYTLSFGKKYAILGPNGSGKSTLLKIIASNLSPSEGQILYKTNDGSPIEVDKVFQDITMAAPYVELLEEFTLREMIDFHFKFKSFLPGFTADRLIDLLQLDKAVDKEIRFFSSGMKQRVKLALTCCAGTPLVLLDEPTSNLDAAGETWYLNLIQETIGPERMLIIGSNQEREYAFCDESLNILSYK
ncbi:ABC transporter ATP-binding protein [Sphingobacterium deserti]|uniref:ABC transporter-like protein n=1 Tax=Sphingobacterium deserti TaxID=1229276 RepID=A0A0B8T728_9SPHI|nr:ATP-binding cassette domain-containing protein [Sphingobacterium deserti]KGE14129.1 ABC transporter-like protein [Sphingobacterium deserti]